MRRDVEKIADRFAALIERAEARGHVLPTLTLRLGDPASFPKPRDCAYMMFDSDTKALTLVVAPKMADLPTANVDGLLAHEFGHAVLMAAGEDHSERDADRVARKLFGTRVHYDARDVQTTARGTSPRPKRLPR